MLKKLVLCFAVIQSSLAFSQNEDVISYFNASELNGKVLLTWAIKQGNTCNGIQILRSVDSVNFTQIGSINGICGSTQAQTPYDFTDVNPIKNAINYYRLSLGGVGFSWIVSAEVIDIAGSNYLLRPNPFSSSAELHFQNDASNFIDFDVYNEQGVLVHSRTTNEDLLLLTNDDLQPGIYFFTLRDAIKGSLVRGKFVVI